MSVSITVHNPDVADVVYFPHTDEATFRAFSRVRMEGKDSDITIMVSDPYEAYKLAEALTKAGDMLSIGGNGQRKWIPRDKRESE